MRPLTFPRKNIPTKALVVEEPGAPFVLRDVVLDEVRSDEVRSDEVLVEMLFTGICHTVRSMLQIGHNVKMSEDIRLTQP